MEPKEFDFEFPRGDTCPLSFTIHDSEKNELSNFDEIYFTLKKNYTQNDYLLQKRLSRKEITYSENQYNLILVKSGIYYKTICKGTITLSNESTFISNE